MKSWDHDHPTNTSNMQSQNKTIDEDVTKTKYSERESVITAYSIWITMQLITEFFEKKNNNKKL